MVGVGVTQHPAPAQGNRHPVEAVVLDDHNRAADLPRTVPIRQVWRLSLKLTLH